MSSAVKRIRNVMDLTKEFIKAKQPCASGLRWFLRHYESGSDYQPLLDSLVEAGRIDDAVWLIGQFGPTSEVRTVDSIDAHAVVFAGHLEVLGNIDVDTVLYAGRSINARGAIRAGTAINCGADLVTGGGIHCGGAIEAGEGINAQWGIEAAGPIRARGDLRCGWSLTCGDSLNVGGNCQAGADIEVAGPVACTKGIRAAGAITCRDQVRAGHGIESGADILCEGHLEANFGIKARAGITAHGSIRAGESLLAGDEIRAGDGHPVFAGLSVRVDAWQDSGQVHARTKPDRLLSGWWAGT